MAGETFGATPPRPVAAAGPKPALQRPRFMRARVIEKTPPRHGEKPYEQLVADAFDGPVLRLSAKVRLLEEADNRQIRRGDALDLIAATRQALEAEHAVTGPGRLEIFIRQYAAFVACYATLALMLCTVMLLSGNGGGAGSAHASDAEASARALDSEMYATGVNPPFDQ